MTPLADVIDTHAQSRPDGLAFASGALRLSWAQYAQRSDGLAARLCSLGLEAGARVAVLLPDGPGVHIAFVACEKAGLVAVGIGPRAGSQEIRHLLAKTGASAFITRPTHRDTDLHALVASLRDEGFGLAHHLIEASEFEAYGVGKAALDRSRETPHTSCGKPTSASHRSGRAWCSPSAPKRRANICPSSTSAAPSPSDSPAAPSWRSPPIRR